MFLFKFRFQTKAGLSFFFFFFFFFLVPVDGAVDVVLPEEVPPPSGADMLTRGRRPVVVARPELSPPHILVMEDWLASLPLSVFDFFMPNVKLLATVFHLSINVRKSF